MDQDCSILDASIASLARMLWKNMKNIVKIIAQLQLKYQKIFSNSKTLTDK
jgi:hypothetical protein